jgi:gamma-glutamyltranspeptidase
MAHHRNHRPLIMGGTGAVGSNHPLATQAGLDTLRAGGNAADAAVAISLSLGVCEPGMSGVGADGFYHALDSQSGASTVYNGSGAAPKSARPEKYSDGIPICGPGSVSVPGALGALSAMHEAHGKLPWADLVKPAIDLARDGFAATHTYCYFTNDWPGSKQAILTDPRSTKTFLGHGLGDLVVQPDLAGTLEEIAGDGSETFYRGRLAKRLAKGMMESGVEIDESDLAAFQPEITRPIGVNYRGWEVRQTPPNSTGFTMLQMLKIVERFNVGALSEAERIHLLVEAKKLAFLDRETYGFDPRSGDIPIEMLLSESRADEYAAKIDMTRASNIPLMSEDAKGDTTYFCVVDAAGNAVSGIQSLASAFGSGVTAGDTGVLLNNRLAYFSLRPGHPNALKPGKRVRHTMNCPLVLKDRKLWSVLGTPGADHQVQINLQLLTALIDCNIDPQSAVESPRWSSSQVGQGTWPQIGDGRLTIESDFDTAVLSELEARGHSLNRVPQLACPGAAHIIRINTNEVRIAGSDPRRDGWAGAY